MFFQEKIQSIKKEYKVLEVGPGANPYYRSNVLLEKRFDTEDIAHAQRGYTQKLKTNKEIVYYKGCKFPFKDKEFDYVICSHVIEHIPIQEVPEFISELQRVAHMGYLEFPNHLYEFVNNQDVHISLINYKNDTIYFMAKDSLLQNPIQNIYRKLFYSYPNKIFDYNKELFFTGFEWRDKINYKIVNNLDLLFNQNDELAALSIISKNMQMSTLHRFIKRIIRKNLLLIKQYITN